ncbi:methyl-accepting chemotaxis protein [Burkholderia plantarii]|uniref:Methyl-accepting chemotaxis sensory transducer n=1 Tax=Burkholderia plantarii TaxID=41899 RepID=A0A0B6SA46_BURPL|nr:methyl-accepting chemotaxis protein [Burkholderia plantarii]AJK50155.1 methyl-accepting chemotaxis sensory transducer [Burkholderia plantarii]
MRNISIRMGLLFVLAIFGVMIVFGGATGIASLHAANGSTSRVHAISARVIRLNDAYKDMTRARSALVRAYSTAREQASVDTGAIGSAQGSLDKSAAELQAFADAPAIEGHDEALRQDIVRLARTHADAVQRGLDALRDNDPARYAAINTTDITASGAAYSAALERFQQQAGQLAQAEADLGAARYAMVVRLVGFGVVAALGLVVGMHFALRGLVVRPLNEVVRLLDRVADGDLGIAIPRAGDNEVGRLFGAIERMKGGLTRTVRQVLSSSDSVNVGARQIAAGNLDLSSRTEQQSAALEQTAASMQELSATVTRNAENARTASSLAGEAAQLATRGGEMVRGVVSTMNGIDGSASRMAEMIGVIDGIAFQTNILALNAAVEAARAGEQGRGFAVVASEVRTLAQRSAGAAREIRVLIDDSLGKVWAGNTQVAQAGAAIDETVRAVQRVAGIVQEISTESGEQASGIVQIGQAVAQMEQVTQQNAALVEEAAAAAGSLETQARQLEAAASSFRLA